MKKKKKRRAHRAAEFGSKVEPREQSARCTRPVVLGAVCGPSSVGVQLRQELVDALYIHNHRQNHRELDFY